MSNTNSNNSSSSSSNSNNNAWSLRQKIIVASGIFLAYWYSDAVQNGIRITTQRTMACSSARAFSAVTDFEIMPQISDDVLGYDFPDEPGQNHKMHLGLKFSERRRMGSDTLVTNLHVTEFLTNDHHETGATHKVDAHARMVADTHGTIWDTTFDVYHTSSDNNANVILKLSMHARAHEWIPKLINPIMQVLFRYGLNKHMDQVKVWCEQQQQSQPQQ